TLKQVAEFSIDVRLKSAEATKWVSPSHALTATPDGRDVVLTASAKNARLDRDVRLDLTDSNAANAPTKFSTMVHDGYRYVMLRHRMAASATPQAAKKRQNYVFLFETSADRDPLLARTQVEIVRSMLENLEHDDTFAIVTAATRAQLLDEKP